MQSVENSDIEISKKIDQVYKEILSKSIYIIGGDDPRELTKEDIQVFSQALIRLYELEEEYSQRFNSRQSLGNKISDLASHLMILADRIYSKIRTDAVEYKASNELFIRDFEKFINILFNAQNSSDFALKKIYASGMASYEIKRGIREDKQIYGLVYIIGDSTALSEFEDGKVYWADDIRRINTKILESGKSLIIASNYYFETNLLPNYLFPTTNSSCLEIKGNSSIYCYLQDDVIKEVVSKLLAFAAENGNRINDIPETEILNSISINQKNKKRS